MMKTIRTAVAGLGSMGTGHHCEMLSRLEGFELVAGYDIVPERLKKVQEKYAFMPYSDWKEFLACRRIELVTIAAPSSFHAPMAIDALKAGKHVIVEKPMCMNELEADTMIEMAKKKGKMLSVFQNRRWDSGHLTLKKAIEDGLLGEIYSIKMVSMGYSRLMLTYGVKEFRPHWRSEKKYGGGVLFDFGAHSIDQLCQLVKSKPVDVYGHLESRLWTDEVDTSFLAIIRFENGVVAQVENSHTSPLGFGGMHIVGTKGALSGKHVKIVEDGEEKEFDLESVEGSWDEYYQNIHAVLTEGAELIVKPEQVRVVMQIMDAIRESNETRQVVKIG